MSRRCLHNTANVPSHAIEPKGWPKPVPTPGQRRATQVVVGPNPEGFGTSGADGVTPYNGSGCGNVGAQNIKCFADVLLGLLGILILLPAGWTSTRCDTRGARKMLHHLRSPFPVGFPPLQATWRMCQCRCHQCQCRWVGTFSWCATR